MKKLLSERGMAGRYAVSSLATSFEEIGNDIYPPMKRALAQAGIRFERHAARRFERGDYDYADAVFYMDEHNRKVLEFIHPDNEGKYHLITRFTPHIDEIEDPWYSHRFDLVVRQLTECCSSILDHLADFGLE